MSLINRMLRDLSSRQPDAGNVMSGIHVPEAAPAPRGGGLGRLGLLVVLVAAFTAGLWWMFGPKPVKARQPRGPEVVEVAAPAPASATTPETSQAAPAPVVARAPEQPAHLKMDTELSKPVGAPAPARPVAVAPVAPKPKLRPAPSLEQAGVEAAAPAEAAQEPAKGPQMAVAPSAPRVRNADELYVEARRALERGDTKAGEASLIEALAANPQHHAAREELGSLRIRQGRFDEAEHNVRIGMDQDPAWPGYRRLVARLELARRNPAGAIEALEKDPPPLESDVEYHALLAAAYQRVNRHDDASRVYQALARAQPEQANWWAGYAMSRDALNDVPGALAGYARARQLGGLDPRVLEHINRRTAVLQSAG